MELLTRGESNKRKLEEEEEEELVPPGLEDVVLKSSPESDESDDYSITKLDDIRKEGQLEILKRSKRVFRDYYEEQEEVFRDYYKEEKQQEEEEKEEGFRDYYEEEEQEEVFRDYYKEQEQEEEEKEEVFRDYYEEEEQEEEGEEVSVFREYYKLKKYQPQEEDEEEYDDDDERVLPPCLVSNIDSDYPRIISEYTPPDEGQILQSARVVVNEYDLHYDGRMIGQEIVAQCFRDEGSYESSIYYNGTLDVDAAFLKSGLDYYQQIYPGDLDFCPDWEELAKYVNQLRKTEGFELDEYKNLGEFADNLPRRLSDERLRCFDKEIGRCIKAAMKLYMKAGGAELKAPKLVKANLIQESCWCTFYITFTAQSCVDGKERHYQAIATYSERRRRVSHDRGLMVRLMKEP